MELFKCTRQYLADFNEYSEKVLIKGGFSSQLAERETLYLADIGNVVAKKTYGDLLFYKKILRKNHYRDAFRVYMEASGLVIDQNGELVCTGHAYPLAFWFIGYYLVNYKCDSYLKICEPIEEIDEMDRAKRLKYALLLAASTVKEIKSSASINLIGRILKEASENEVLFKELKNTIAFVVDNSDFELDGNRIVIPENAEECSKTSEAYFIIAADEGYVYACNNLAAREAGRIVEMVLSKNPVTDERTVVNSELTEEISESIEKYIIYLKKSATKYEPYAANRLGLFYMTGEIWTPSRKSKVCFREYIDYSLAKEYFVKATVYPDSNSAWAFYNLIKYFHKDYSRNIDLLNEHMDYIRQLNPKVYDIAMDN